MHIKLITLLYLDPGSGSFILQIAIAAALGGAYALKVYWKKIKGFLHKNSSVEETSILDDVDSPVSEESDVKE